MNTNGNDGGNDKEQYDASDLQSNLQHELRKLKDSFPESKDKFELGDESKEGSPGIIVNEDPEARKLRAEGKALEYLSRINKRRKEVSDWLRAKEKAADLEAAAKRRRKK